MSMNERQRVAQMQAIHCTYKRLFANGVVEALHENPGISCHLWATKTLCRLISSLKVCGDAELNVLRDTLNGKPSKVHARLRDVLSKTKKDPDAWVHWMMNHAPNFKRYREPEKKYTVETIPWIEAFRMLKQEEARSGGAQYRKGSWKPLMLRGPAPRSISEEQRTLWGQQ